MPFVTSRSMINTEMRGEYKMAKKQFIKGGKSMKKRQQYTHYYYQPYYRFSILDQHTKIDVNIFKIDQIK